MANLISKGGARLWQGGGKCPPPPKWNPVYVWVSARWQSQWCSKNLCRAFLLFTLMNARHCGVSLTKCTYRTWSSCMHVTDIRMWLNLRQQNVTKKVWMRITHNVRRLVQHMLQVMEMAWTDDSTPAISFLHTLHTSSLHRARNFNTGTVSQETKTNGIERLPCGYLYCSRHWIGKSMSVLHPCCRHWGGRLSMAGFMLQLLSHVWINIWRITRKHKSWRWLTALHTKNLNCVFINEIRWFKLFGKWSVQASKHTHTPITLHYVAQFLCSCYELRHPKWVLPNSKKPEKQNRNLVEQNTWIRSNVFDALGNYKYCCNCIIHTLGIGSQWLAHQRSISERFVFLLWTWQSLVLSVTVFRNSPGNNFKKWWATLWGDRPT